MLSGHDYRHNSIYSNDSVNAHLQRTNAFKATKRMAKKGFFFSFFAIRFVCHIFI